MQNNFFSAKLDAVIRKLDLLSQDVRFLLQIIQRNSIAEAADVPENLKLPLETEKELIEFDTNLGTDEEFFRNVVCIFMYWIIHLK